MTSTQIIDDLHAIWLDQRDSPELLPYPTDALTRAWLAVVDLRLMVQHPATRGGRDLDVIVYEMDAMTEHIDMITGLRADIIIIAAASGSRAISSTNADEMSLFDRVSEAVRIYRGRCGAAEI
jgi:hypothetical protein